MTARTVGLSQAQGKADTKGKRGLTAWITGPQVWAWARTVAAAGRPEQVGMGEGGDGDPVTKGGQY